MLKPMSLMKKGFWDELLELEVFKNKSSPHYHECKKWLDLLIKDGSYIRQTEIIRIEGLLNAVYEAGRKSK